jgi:hypothetical protein
MSGLNSDPVLQQRNLKDIYNNPAEGLFSLSKDEVIKAIKERVELWQDPLPAGDMQQADSAGIPVDQLTVGDYVLFVMLASQSANAPTSGNVDVAIAGIGSRGIDFGKIIEEGTTVGSLFDTNIPRNTVPDNRKPLRLKVIDDSTAMSVYLTPGKRTFGEDPERYYLRANPIYVASRRVPSDAHDLNLLFIELGLNKEVDMESDDV